MMLSSACSLSRDDQNSYCVICQNSPGYPGLTVELSLVLREQSPHCLCESVKHLEEVIS